MAMQRPTQLLLLTVATALLTSACGNDAEGPRRRSARKTSVTTSGPKLKTLLADAPSGAEKRNQLLVTQLESAERWFEVGAEMQGQKLTLQGMSISHDCREGEQVFPDISLELIRKKEDGSITRTPIFSLPQARASQAVVSSPAPEATLEAKGVQWVSARVQNYGSCSRVELSFDFSLNSP
jgi:hypothetical protein